VLILCDFNREMEDLLYLLIMVWWHSRLMAGFTQLFAGWWRSGTAAIPFESGGIEDSGPASKGTPHKHLM
jgi:hypothetical protein